MKYPIYEQADKIKYVLHTGGSLTGEFDILAHVAKEILDELGRSEIESVGIKEVDDTTFQYKDYEFVITVDRGEKKEPLSRNEKVELFLLLTGDRELTSEEVRELEARVK